MMHLAAKQDSRVFKYGFENRRHLGFSQWKTKGIIVFEDNAQRPQVLH
jgi:hypothetical protein